MVEKKRTRNSSLDETDERYRLNNAVHVKLHHPYTKLTAYLIGES